MPGTNGLAFDRAGNIRTGDGTTGQGRVWKIATGGVVTEALRVQPMANEVNLVAGVGAPKGKISCMDQPLKIQGLRLPVRGGD